MPSAPALLPTTELAPGLVVPRLVMGLWQVADMERGGTALDPGRAADALADYADAGFAAFDMADHYGSAEDIVGTLRARGTHPGVRAFTKWCPPPGVMDAATVRAGIDRARQRLRTDRIDLLQFHWWQYTHPAWLDALHELAALRQAGAIGHLGLTNFDTDHLRVALKDGLPIATNQVSFSLLDRRAAGRLSALCLAHGVKLLAYGTLAGGFLSERWLGAAEPAAVDDWSKRKYRRFIDAIGGWAALQAILSAAQHIARRHGVSIANVALRWVLQQPAVGAAIVGIRPGENEHRARNRQVFDFALDAADLARLDEAFAGSRDPHGDCGDEYRRPPFLTAAGDLSDHLAALPAPYPVVDESRAGPVPRRRVDTGSPWEPLAGYARAVRVGSRVLVSGTTATQGPGRLVAPGDAEAQAVHALDRVQAAIEALGGGLDDVVRTRIYLRDEEAWRGVAEAHGRRFGAVRPANTLVGGVRLVGGYEVEIEAEAELPPGPPSAAGSGAQAAT